MNENRAKEVAREHLGTEREPRLAASTEIGGRTCWQVSFMGDEQEPVIVTIDDQSEKVLQVFEPLKVAPVEMRDLITGDTEKFKTQD